MNKDYLKNVILDHDVARRRQERWRYLSQNTACVEMAADDGKIRRIR